jgi:hypothetical protein
VTTLLILVSLLATSLYRGELGRGAALKLLRVRGSGPRIERLVTGLPQMILPQTADYDEFVSNTSRGPTYAVLPISGWPQSLDTSQTPAVQTPAWFEHCRVNTDSYWFQWDVFSPDFRWAGSVSGHHELSDDVRYALRFPFAHSLLDPADADNDGNPEMLLVWTYRLPEQHSLRRHAFISLNRKHYEIHWAADFHWGCVYGTVPDVDHAHTINLTNYHDDIDVCRFRVAAWDPDRRIYVTSASDEQTLVECGISLWKPPGGRSMIVRVSEGIDVVLERTLPSLETWRVDPWTGR